MSATRQPAADLAEFTKRYCDDINEFGLDYPDTVTYSVDLDDLVTYSLDVADQLETEPDVVLSDLRDNLKNQAHTVDMPELQVAITGVDPIDVSELRSDHLGQYIAVAGRVSSLSEVRPRALTHTYECKQGDCRKRIEVAQSGTTSNDPPAQCPTCERQGNWELVDSETVDSQRITLTDREPDMATAQELSFYVTRDQVNSVDAGDTAVAYGIYAVDGDKTTKRTEDRIVDTRFDARFIEPEGASFDSYDPERIEEIKALAERDDIYEAVRDSIAPSIHGHETIKLALALQLFAGVRRTLPSGIDRPGDINILLVGDPGTGKSALIKTASEIAPKSVFASGKGATAAGLTATAQQIQGGEWQLEAGALVLANGGLAAIDEFDKMEDSARKSMHEALEGQQIPINKAGINTVLPAECSVLAGANPVGETWDRFEPLNDQLNLGPALITRFDLIFSLTDTPDEDRDSAIAEAMLTHDGTTHRPVIETDLLREFIAYARQEITPEWTDDARERATEYFIDLRQRSEDTSPISPRVNNDIRKLSEASARVRLAETVTPADVDRAIALKDEHIEHVGMDSDGNVSGNLLDGGRVTQQDRIEIIRSAIDAEGGLSMDALLDRGQEYGLSEEQVRDTVDSLKQRGDIYEPETGTYRTA